MEKPRTPKELISALGGPIKVARALDLLQPIPTTIHWGARGIPARYWHRIAEIASAKGIPVTPHDIEQISREAA